MKIISQNSAEYPDLLREIAEPPKQLYVRGDARVLKRKNCVAVVGARSATTYGLSATNKIVEELAAAGTVIVSGLAFGIDIAAHRAAVKFGGKTVAVVPGGVDDLSIYPRTHRRFAEEIAKSGCVISERPPGSRIQPYTFLARNRIIGGLCPGTIIVECAEKSGALITAKYARDENRNVYAVPGSIFNPMSRGPNILIAQGAMPVYGAAEILDDLDFGAPTAREKLANLTAVEKQVLQYINSIPAGADSIIAAVLAGGGNAPNAEIIAALTTLELKGLIASSAAGHYYLIN